MGTCDNCGIDGRVYGFGNGLLLCDHCLRVQAELDRAAKHVLMEREYAGIRVQLQHLPMTDLTGITVQVGTEQQYRTVPREKALDAFEHPMIYLAAEQVAELGVK